MVATLIYIFIISDFFEFVKNRHARLAIFLLSYFTVTFSFMVCLFDRDSEFHGAAVVGGVIGGVIGALTGW